MGQGFGRDRRLRQRREFDRVFRQGRRVRGGLFTLMALPNGRGYHRLGIAVGRRVGSAVGRNRARRLLREAFRRLSSTVVPAHDMVLVAQPQMKGRTQAEVDVELSKRFEQLAGRGRAGAPAAH
jgi:ribonuclease P protein component